MGVRTLYTYIYNIFFKLYNLFCVVVSQQCVFLKRHGNGCRHGSGRRSRIPSPSPSSRAPPELVRNAGRFVVVLQGRATGGRQHDRPHELVLRAPSRQRAGRTPRGQGLSPPPGRSGCHGRGRRAVSSRLAHRHRPVLSSADPLAVRTSAADLVAR